MNVGIRRALSRRASAVAVLNDDVVVEPGWLDPLWPSSIATQRRRGAAPARVPGPAAASEQSGRAARPRRRRYRCRHGAAGRREHHGRRTTSSCSPAARCCCAPSSCVEVGVFDDRYFLYYEDVDLGLRGRRLGWRYRCVPASIVVHEGGATVERVGHRAAYLRERNRLWILLRYRPAGDVGRGHVVVDQASPVVATAGAPSCARRRPGRRAAPRVVAFRPTGFVGSPSHADRERRWQLLRQVRLEQPDRAPDDERLLRPRSMQHSNRSLQRSSSRSAAVRVM